MLIFTEAAVFERRNVYKKDLKLVLAHKENQDRIYNQNVMSVYENQCEKMKYKNKKKSGNKNLNINLNSKDGNKFNSKDGDKLNSKEENKYNSKDGNKQNNDDKQNNENKQNSKVDYENKGELAKKVKKNKLNNIASLSSSIIPSNLVSDRIKQNNPEITAKDFMSNANKNYLLKDFLKKKNKKGKSEKEFEKIFEKLSSKKFEFSFREAVNLIGGNISGAKRGKKPEYGDVAVYSRKFNCFKFADEHLVSFRKNIYEIKNGEVFKNREREQIKKISKKIPLLQSFIALTSKRTNKSEIRLSSLEGLGLFAKKLYKENELITIYKGLRVSKKTSNLLEKYYNKDASFKSKVYMFTYSNPKDGILFVEDATVYGTFSKFINHSCKPNSYSCFYYCNGWIGVAMFTNRTVLKGEEFNYDYKINDKVLKCCCGSSNCRGYI